MYVGDIETLLIVYYWSFTCDHNAYRNIWYCISNDLILESSFVELAPNFQPYFCISLPYSILRFRGGARSSISSLNASSSCPSATNYTGALPWLPTWIRYTTISPLGSRVRWIFLLWSIGTCPYFRRTIAKWDDVASHPKMELWESEPPFVGTTLNNT